MAPPTPTLVITQPEQRMTALEQAMEQMDLCTASLHVEQTAGTDEPAGSRMSSGDHSHEQATPAGHLMNTGDTALVLESPRVKARIASNITHHHVTTDPCFHIVASNHC